MELAAAAATGPAEMATPPQSTAAGLLEGAGDLFQLAGEPCQQEHFLVCDIGDQAEAGDRGGLPDEAERAALLEMSHDLNLGLGGASGELGETPSVLVEADVVHVFNEANEGAQHQQQQQQQQQPQQGERLEHSYASPLENVVRQERSNSCSGADSVSVARSLAAQAAGIPTPTGPMLAGSVDAINVTASVSQHDLIVGCGDEPTSLNFVESLLVEQSGGVAIDNEQPLVAEGSLHGDCSFTLPRAITDISTIGPSQSSTSLSSSPPQQAASGFEKQQLHSSKVHDQPNNEPQTASRNQNSSSSSSRFFSSKLNTGSLWSLLSVGSSNSMSAINEIAGPEVDDSTRDSLDAGEQPSFNQEATRGLHQKTPSGGAQQIRDFTTRSASNFFNQFKPKVVVDHHHQSSSANGRSQDSTPSAGPAGTTKAKEMGNQDSSRARSSRYRFNIKYVGSAMLHKNFTLPMLEWITKDIRRQTTRHGLNQRQFTIPVRDIIFEIHAKQLMAISCKDGHCIFVHPMHCVSKYAQLQHDSSSFAYIIRDSKDSPNFCHVFQTKSPNRVHEIFVAIREVTTRNQFASLPANSSLSSMNKHYQAANQQQAAELASLRLQKSASSDGHWRGSAAFAELNNSTLSMMDSPIPSSAKSPPAVIPLTSAQTDNPLLARYNNSPQQMQQQRNIVHHHHHHQQASSQLAETISQQFENSYQFEVMFVKRVKLQCRRVPASFVDDALETLKTFEVPKSTQIKHGVVTKRIISASVDERQEYDESCQSPTPGASKSSLESALDNNKRLGSEIMPSLTTTSNSDSDRRGSSVSLRGQDRLSPSKSRQEANRESKSCQQSPAKQSPSANNPAAADQKEELTATASSNSASSSSSIRDDLLTTTDAEIRSKIIGIRQTEKVNPPSYTNDFSPYNTITSSDLNERIAAIPVVSGSSVSLDHETRQKLARQVRETIMATAANIKKDVYASGDNLNAIGSSSRVLDSLSCTQQVAPETPQDTFNLIELDPISAEPAADLALDHSETTAPARQEEASQGISAAAQRRASAGPAFASASGGGLQHQQAAANNFDLFRRASARQVVKNRTMLLLIGKDELCAISIDKHQMLFSKSFNSIVHCLSGTKNRDHFGLICRDSVKIQPQAEAYAGFVFKCQSEKVVREIMGALKQVIYSSQHNYHGLNSPYNPLNSLSSVQAQFNVSSKQQLQSTSKTFASDQRQRLTSSSMDSSSFQSSAQQQSSTSGSTRALVGSSISSSPQAQTGVSLAAKRGFANPLEMNGSTPLAQSNDLASANVALHAVSQAASAMPTPPPPPPPPTAPPALGNVFTMPAPKNPIKSMFCDDCPLYWFHRLCCDIESLPAEASKAIILRRIDSSLSEQEQDEVFTKFSEHKIESIEEHNEIFMSVLRHLSEKKQFKHSQLAAHQNALAKNSLLVKKQSFDLLNKLQPSSSGNAAQQAKQQQQQQQQASNANTNAAVVASQNRGHQRSGSSGGSLAFVMGQPNGGQVNQSSLVDASSLAIDNLKRAKNSISVSIENLLKRRSSLRDEQNEADSAADASVLLLQTDATGHLPLRTGSFKSASREARQMTHQAQADETTANEPLLPGKDQAINNLRRSQSTSDYSQTSLQGNLARLPAATWRDSLSKTLNAEELTNPLVGFFRRRGSLANSETTTGAQDSGSVDHHGGAKTNSQRASTESLSICAAANGEGHSPSMSRPHPPSASRSGQSSPTNTSRMLSGSFWKKSIFDMVQKTSHAGQTANGHTYEEQPKEGMEQQRPAVKRSRAELRLLWRKAIREQITLLKMDKQNQELLKKTSAKCEQVSKGSTTNSTTAPEVSTMPTNQSATSTNNNNNNSKDEPPSNAQFIHSTIEGIKLNYAPVRWPPEAQQQWDRILKQDPTKKVQFSEVARLVRFGVPMKRRGEIWMFLMNQYQLRYGTSFQPVGSDFKGDANQTYRGLLSQLSTQQHEIFVDIGRTFPSHPYYSQYLSIGQLSLFNLLKAYSLLDRQVGYCQGLSFVAGILLLHVDSEDEAFELMRHLMFNFGLRKQYLPSMDALHLQLYQMTRLLRDHEFAIFDHFDKHDISPSLYAAPWFLTLFASQFPLGFVTRLLDLIYLIGIEAIFRVSLTLLAFHRASIIKCSSLEFTMDFMRDGLSKIDDKNLVKIFTDALALDLRNKLIEYEIEYSFYCAEDKARAQSGTHHHYQHHHHHHRAGLSSRQSENSSSSTVNQDVKRDQDFELDLTPVANDSAVADATATVIIQHLLANNHLKSLRSNYSY